MANEKFEPGEIITDTEVRLECLRLATEFGPEFDRRDPLPIAEKYFDWVTTKFWATTLKMRNRQEKRQSEVLKFTDATSNLEIIKSIKSTTT